jgi:hypothetical protein
MAGNVRAVLLGSPQALFLCDKPSRRSVDQIVVSEPGAMPRAIRLEFAVSGHVLAVSGDGADGKLLN